MCAVFLRANVDTFNVKTKKNYFNATYNWYVEVLFYCWYLRKFFFSFCLLAAPSGACNKLMERFIQAMKIEL